MNPLIIVNCVGKILERNDFVTPQDVQFALRRNKDLENKIVSVEEIILVMNVLVASSFLEQVSSYGVGKWRRFIPESIKNRIAKRGDKNNHRTRRDDNPPTPSSSAPNAPLAIH